jgi:predicted metal-dependent hydrolase
MARRPRLSDPETDRSRCAEPPPPGVLKGIEEFNRGEFFEAHESIEEEWIPERNHIRLLWQGILQIGVGFHHLQRGSWKSAVVMLERGLPKIRPFLPRCQGIDVRDLHDRAERCLRELRALGPDRLGEFDTDLIPVIRLGTPA